MLGHTANPNGETLVQNNDSPIIKQVAFSMAGISRRDSRTSLGPGPAGTQGTGTKAQNFAIFWSFLSKKLTKIHQN